MNDIIRLPVHKVPAHLVSKSSNRVGEVSFCQGRHPPPSLSFSLSLSFFLFLLHHLCDSMYLRNEQRPLLRFRRPSHFSLSRSLVTVAIHPTTALLTDHNLK